MERGRAPLFEGMKKRERADKGGKKTGDFRGERAKTKRGEKKSLPAKKKASKIR